MKLKRGYIRDDGKHFWGYRKDKERWLTPEQFQRAKAYSAEYKKSETYITKYRAYVEDPINKAVAAEKRRLKYLETMLDETARQKHNKECRKRNIKYKANNKDKTREYNSRPETVKKNAERRKRYLEDPQKKEIWKESKRLYMRKRREDIMFRTIGNFRHRICEFLKTKNWKKNTKTLDMLGCSKDEFRAYIENKFTEGMTWNNYGNKYDNWSYDHIIPLSSASNIEELITLCHYTNIQPLWAIDNIKKGNKTL